MAYRMLTSTPEQEAFLRAYDYEVLSRAEFEAAALPAGLRERAAEYPGAFVVFDPLADDEGFMLVGDNLAEIVQEAYEHLVGLL